MRYRVKREVKAIIKQYKLDCSVEEFGDKVDWEMVSLYQNCSENFIEEYKDRVDWIFISAYKKNLSEEFIEKYEDRVSWDCISGCQKLSEDFIRRFKSRLRLDHLLCNWNVSISYRLWEEMEELGRKRFDQVIECSTGGEVPLEYDLIDNRFDILDL